jgi:hypothetical protein
LEHNSVILSVGRQRKRFVVSDLYALVLFINQDRQRVILWCLSCIRRPSDFTGARQNKGVGTPSGANKHRDNYHQLDGHYCACCVRSGMRCAFARLMIPPEAGFRAGRMLSTIRNAGISGLIIAVLVPAIGRSVFLLELLEPTNEPRSVPFHRLGHS